MCSLVAAGETMSHRLRVSALARFLLLICLASPFFAAQSVVAESAPVLWQPLGGPAGRLTHLSADQGGRELYAVAAASVNRQVGQTQSSETGIPRESNA